MDNRHCNKRENKVIWFIDYYAYLPEDGPHIRHYAFGKYLKKKGYTSIVFASNELHGVRARINTKDKLYLEKIRDGVKFFYVKAHHYEENDIHRIISMFSFEKNLRKIAKEVAAKYGKPDYIFASSLNPTSFATGVKFKKQYGAKLIEETRDIIPYNFVSAGSVKENGFVCKCAKKYMKHYYEKADALVFTMSGGSRFISDQKWDISNGGKIDGKRVFYINNGVDLEVSDKNRDMYTLEDSDLDDPGIFTVVYLGAIRLANKIPLFVETAKELKRLGRADIKILMWGTGTKLEETKKQLQDNGIDNMILKGAVEKKYIPGIASRADLAILTANLSCVDRYGASPNKLFDYFAAGLPVIVPAMLSDAMIKDNGAGSELYQPDGKTMAEEIIRYADMSKEEYQGYRVRSRKMAEKFCYKTLTEKLEEDILSFL